jgi:lipid II:glycine glycyltransferase (peptidoglycan interpeptide bridge formation enzyme)
MRPNDLAHWELIQWAISMGLRVFDFGSARYRGQIQFKKKWGVSLHEYCNYTIGPPNSAFRSKIQTMRTNSSRMTAVSRLRGWIVPVGLTRLLGPAIRKYWTK